MSGVVSKNTILLMGFVLTSVSISSSFLKVCKEEKKENDVRVLHLMI